MGEIADMMLDGTMCAGCGEWMHGGEDGHGYPQYCSACAQEVETPVSLKVRCPTCGKRVKQRGLRDHQRDVHGVAASESAVDQFLPF